MTMFDLAPDAVAGILGDRLPRRVARAYRRFRRGPGAFKVDFAVEGGVPVDQPATPAGPAPCTWPASFAELAATERDIHAGRMPERPFVLVGQQYLADPQRSVGNIHPVWSYAHVPNGYTGDATEAIIAQIERFAPGFRDRIVGHTVRSTTQMAAYNPNFVGGDIMTGAKDIRQLTFGPRITLSPYSIGVPGMYICSAATPPGPGAHGMCGANAAQSALAPELRTQNLINQGGPHDHCYRPSFDLFTLTDEHHELRAAIRALTERDIVPQAADCDESERFPQEALDALTQSGFNAVHIPEAYGGQGADGVATCIVVEEIARGCCSSSLIPAVNKLGTTGLILAGGEDLKQQVLPDIANGAMASYALSEREAGSMRPACAPAPAPRATIGSSTAPSAGSPTAASPPGTP